jgi:hypothetical protein
MELGNRNVHCSDATSFFTTVHKEGHRVPMVLMETCISYANSSQTQQTYKDCQHCMVALLEGEANYPRTTGT